MKKNMPSHPLLALLTMFLLVIITVPGFATNTKTWNKSDNNNPNSINHKQWQMTLDRYLITNHPSGVNRFRYSDVTVADKKVLKKYLSELQKIDPRSYKRAEQMAYWINLYNALTVDLILDGYPVKSIKKLGKALFSFGPWDDEVAKIAGQDLSLNDIEHKILRPIWQDPRIHYAVNCASYGCPNLAAKAFTAINTDTLLNQGANDYINHNRGVHFDNGKLIVSSIYHWYAEDFGDSDKMLIKHLQKYAKPKLKQQLDTYQGAIDHEYDWSLNE
jgi:hypothetical protein